MNQSTNNCKVAKRENYDEICRELGFLPECEFVKIMNRGTITFTCGSPEEVKALYKAVIDHRYKPAASLTNVARTLFYQLPQPTPSSELDDTWLQNWA